MRKRLNDRKSEGGEKERLKIMMSMTKGSEDTTSSEDETEREGKAIRLTIPERYLVLPSIGVLTGMSIGVLRGGREASLRFLAENAHRAPSTVKGWYLYKKTKNYRVMMGALKGGGIGGLKIGSSVLGYTVMEDGMERIGLGEVKEVGACLGSASLFSILCLYFLSLLYKVILTL